MAKQLAWIFPTSVILSLALGAAGLGACSSSDDPATTPADTGVKTDTASETATGLGSIKGQIKYAGTKTGPTIYCAMFSSLDPTKPPDLTNTIKPAVFPANYLFKSVGAGKYYIGCYLSVDTDHFTGPTANDPQHMPVEVNLAAGADVVQDITLVEGGPPPGDGGPPPGDGGPPPGDGGPDDASDGG